MINDVTTTWSIDTVHSEIIFKIKHMMISHISGHFRNFDAEIMTHEDDFSKAEINFWIDPSSIDTGDDNRDEHLRGEEFFNISKYKKILFNSTNIVKNSKDNSLEMFGNLTIKNISKKIKLNIEYNGKTKDPWGNDKAGFSVSGKIKRKDWQLNWNSPLENGGIMIDEEVAILCEVQLIKIIEKQSKHNIDKAKNKRSFFAKQLNS